MPTQTDTQIPLSLMSVAAAENWARHRDAQIAAHFGMAVSRVTAIRAENPAFWEMYLERRWMQETFSPLAPRCQLAAQARADRARLRDQRTAARRRDFCCPPPAGTKTALPPSGWSRRGTAVMDWLCRHVALQNALMTWAMLGLAVYFALTLFCPGWLAGIIDFLKGF